MNPSAIFILTMCVLSMRAPQESAGAPGGGERTRIIIDSDANNELDD